MVQRQSETAGAGVRKRGGWCVGGIIRRCAAQAVSCVGGRGRRSQVSQAQVVVPGGLDTLQKQKLRMIMPGMMDSVAMLMSPNWKPVRNWV